MKNSNGTRSFAIWFRRHWLATNRALQGGSVSELPFFPVSVMFRTGFWLVFALSEGFLLLWKAKGQGFYHVERQPPIGSWNFLSWHQWQEEGLWQQRQKREGETENAASIYTTRRGCANFPAVQRSTNQSDRNYYVAFLENWKHHGHRLQKTHQTLAPVGGQLDLNNLSPKKAAVLNCN